MAAELVVEEVSRDRPSVGSQAHARTLKEWRLYFGTHAMEIAIPDGTGHKFSLDAWDGAPDETLIAIYVWERTPACLLYTSRCV